MCEHLQVEKEKAIVLPLRIFDPFPAEGGEGSCFMRHSLRGDPMIPGEPKASSDRPLAPR